MLQILKPEYEFCEGSLQVTVNKAIKELPFKVVDIKHSMTFDPGEGDYCFSAIVIYDDEQGA